MRIIWKLGEITKRILLVFLGFLPKILLKIPLIIRMNGGKLFFRQDKASDILELSKAVFSLKIIFLHS